MDEDLENTSEQIHCSLMSIMFHLWKRPLLKSSQFHGNHPEFQTYGWPPRDSMANRCLCRDQKVTVYSLHPSTSANAQSKKDTIQSHHLKTTLTSTERTWEMIQKSTAEYHTGIHFRHIQETRIKRSWWIWSSFVVRVNDRMNMQVYYINI